jgi:hypothetical protein
MKLPEFDAELNPVGPKPVVEKGLVSNGNEPAIPNGPLIPVNDRNLAVAPLNAPFIIRKDAPGATAGLMAAANDKVLRPPVKNAGGNKVAPGGSRFKPAIDSWLVNGMVNKPGVINILKVEPGRKMKLVPAVWTRIDPAGIVMFGVGFEGLLPGLGLGALGAANWLINGREGVICGGPPL